MENELAATQPEQTTAAPVTTESAPVTTETQTETPPPVEQPKTQDQEPEWFTKRFGEITAKYRETERRAIAAEQQLAQYRQEQEARKEPEKTKTLADFDYDEGRFQAYVIEQAREAARAAAREAEGERKSQESAARRMRKFQEREVEFETERGQRLLVCSTRLVSFEHRHLAAMSYEVSALDSGVRIAMIQYPAA